MRPKLHTVFALPEEKAYVGRIESGTSSWQFRFTPTSATIEDWRLVLTGRVSITNAAGVTKSAEGVKASFLSSQGSTLVAPPIPDNLDQALIPESEPNPQGLPLTEATGVRGSVAVVFYRLSPLDGAKLGLPYDLGQVQLNARPWARSPVERDFLWLYSAVIYATQGPKPSDKLAKGYITEINKRLA